MAMIRRIDFKKLACFILPAAIATLIAMVSLNIWTMDFSIIRFPESDERQGLMMFKSIQESGLYGALFVERLGAPEVSALIDTPFLDWPMIFMIWILTRFVNYNIAYYIFYILTYTSAALAMYVLLSKVSNNYWIRIGLSIAYAITPYHFYRGTIHMTLSNCYILPLGIYLAILIYEEKWHAGILTCENKKKMKNVAVWGIATLAALNNVYYAFFVMLMVLIAVFYKMIEQKTWKPLLHEAVVFYGMCVVFFLGLMPKILYSIIYGSNTLAAVRYPFETEFYGLKIIQLFLPPSYSQIDALAKINSAYTANAINVNENNWSNMGIIAIVGFLVLCGWFIANYIKHFQKDRITQRLNLFAMMALVVLLFCTVAGVGTIFSYVVTPELRCLNRGSIVLVALSLTFLAVVFNKNHKKVIKRCAMWGLLLLLLFASYAEVDYQPYGWSNASEDISRDYSEFFSEIEASLDTGAMIYQLPFSEFPEAAVINNMDDYSHLLGYIYTDTLKWSYGGMKGRNIAAQALNIDGGMSETFIKGIRDAGFSGLYIDTFGYEDNGASIIEYYKELLEQEPLCTEDGRLYFFYI